MEAGERQGAGEVREIETSEHVNQPRENDLRERIPHT